MHPFFKKIVESGNHPNDSEEEKANKSTLVVLAIPFAFAGVIWGTLYFLNDLIIPASIPFSYGILSLLTYLHFSYSKKYKVFRNSQLFLILILPFLLQISLGGFIQSSAVIMWAFIAPVGALVFFKAKQTIAWFMAYMLLVVVSFFINDELPTYFNWDLSNQFINIVFVLNILAVSGLIYAVQYYYVNKQTALKESIEEKSNSLEEYAEKLKENDQMKSRFFANLSHEFRTPLTLILGLLNKQIENSYELPNIQDSETMKRNANRLLQLINQLLDLSKVEAGELKLSVVKENVVPEILKTILLYEPLGFKKDLRFLFNGKPINEINDNSNIIANFDKEKLQKIVSNLISNAVKFNINGGIIDAVVKQEEQELVIIISNTGNPIPTEKIPFIFNRFYQVDGDATREHEGTGIGLALVKELVELHYGTITVSSNTSITSFTIRIPLNEYFFENDQKESEGSSSKIEVNPIVDDVRASEKKYTVSSLTLDSKLNILVVEDNDDIRSYISELLRSDYTISLAVDGKDGLEKAKATIPDLIISDVMMPKMNGYELCEHIKTNESTNHIPIIMLTAKASQENKLEGLEIGADDYLTKPFDKAELKIRIKNLIAIREKLQKKYQQESYLKPVVVDAISVQQKFLQKLKQVVDENMENDEFTVEELGSKLFMSRSQVHRKLKALTGQSATHYIRNYRLHRAADLLKQNAGSVTEIAYQVGFGSQTYFSKCFQQLFNCSPSEYKSKDSQ